MELVGKISKRKPKAKPPILNTIGEALAFPDPVVALWPTLVHAVNLAEPHSELVHLSKPASTLYLTDLVHREVQNGGFHQFFNNVSGRFASQTVAALEEFGAVIFADILRRAILLFPEGPAVDDNLRREALYDLSSEIEEALSNAR